MVYDHHFMQDRNQWISNFDWIGIAKKNISNEQVGGFDKQYDIKDHQEGGNDVFQHKMQSQIGSEYAATFKILMEDTRKIIYHSNIWSALDSMSHNLHLDPLNIDKPLIIKSCHDSFGLMGRVRLRVYLCQPLTCHKK